MIYLITFEKFIVIISETKRFRESYLPKCGTECHHKMLCYVSLKCLSYIKLLIIVFESTWMYKPSFDNYFGHLTVGYENWKPAFQNFQLYRNCTEYSTKLCVLIVCYWLNRFRSYILACLHLKPYYGNKTFKNVFVQISSTQKLDK